MSKQSVRDKVEKILKDFYSQASGCLERSDIEEALTAILVVVESEKELAFNAGRRLGPDGAIDV